MTKTKSPEQSARPYIAPRLIRPDAKDLSPEGKSASSYEFGGPGGTQFGPS